MISGRAEHPVEHYLDEFAALAGLMTAALALTAAAAYAGLRYRLALKRTFLTPFGPGAARLSNASLLVWAVGWGLVMGIGEVVIVTVREAGVGLVSWATSLEVVWMAPATAAAELGCLGLGFAVLGRVVPAFRTVRAVTLVLATVTTFVWIRLGLTSVHPYAAAVLSAGGAIRLASSADRSHHRIAGRVPLIVAGLAVVVAAAGVVHHGRQAFKARTTAVVDLAVTAAPPNILLIALDTVRGQNLSVYGYARPTTPALEEFAQQGTTFDMAVAPSSWTLPSHAGMFTGALPAETSADWEVPMDDTGTTLATFLADRGYRTAGFVANLYYLKEFWGMSRGFQRWEDHPISWSMAAQNEWLAQTTAAAFRELAEVHHEPVSKPAPDVSRDFLSWVDRQDSSRPFFAYLNFFDGHLPYGPLATEDRFFAAADDRYWLDNSFQDYSADEIAQLVNSYDSAIRYLDGALAQLFAEMSQRGILDNTVVIVTSDHGEEFGRHDTRLMEHGNSLYIQSLRVPLLIRYPASVPPDVRVSAPVSLADLPATVLDLIGLASPGPFPGCSLAGHWLEPARDIAEVCRSATPALSALSMHGRGLSFHPISRGPMTSLVAGTLHYIRAGDASEELYDLSVDPEELQNLVGDPDRQEDLQQMRHLLAKAEDRDGRHGS